MELWAQILLGVSAYFVVYSGFTYWLYVRRASYRARAARNDFYEEVDRQLDLGVITNLQDIVRIQRSIAEETRISPFERIDVKRILESYLLRVSGSDKDPELVRQRFELLKEYLNQEPLAILPETEQAIVQRLNQDIQDGLHDEAFRHLRELVSSIGARYQALNEQVSRTRTWTMIGAIGGILGIAVAVATWLLYIR